MLRDLVLETCNAPGSELTISLNGAPTGYRTWLQGFGAGTRGFYFIRGSGALWETGVGFTTVGSPNKFTRETIIDGSSGPGNRVNFTGSVDVYNDQVSARTPYLEATGKIPTGMIPSAIQSASNLSWNRGVWSDSFDPLDIETELSSARITIPTRTRHIAGSAYLVVSSTSSELSTIYMDTMLFNVSGALDSRRNTVLGRVQNIAPFATVSGNFGWSYPSPGLPAGCTLRFHVRKVGGACSISLMQADAHFTTEQ